MLTLPDFQTAKRRTRMRTKASSGNFAYSLPTFLLPLLLSLVSQFVAATPNQKSGVEHPFKVCTVYPHLKDSYWLSVNYGMVEQARDLNIELKVFESGGYSNQIKQQQQLVDCVEWGADAIILGTVSPDLYQHSLRDLIGQTPVFATVNHLELDTFHSKYLKGKVGVDWYQMGFLTGQYLASQHPLNSGRVNISLFPGPDSSGGTKPAIKGFYDAIKGSDVHIIDTLWADNDKELQRNLVQESLQQYDVEYIVGSAVATEAAISEIRSKDGEEQAKLVSIYLSHGVYRGIIRGRVEFSPTDQMVEQGRLSVLQAYDYLTGNPYEYAQAPIIQVITPTDTLENRIDNSLSPSGYRPTFSVESID
ncbi:TMAO reductase system periplasmic protein TorT [Vibrio sp. 10N.261.55.A7]|uniref:TMAO reductase system periplasmic protein TorT n=1 Tax=Vibrio sp. 10N.261.55.A7 TaxID=1880851 RepID=UPI000CB4FDA5|nr:TMAO reductase system periplasmic protein TorT [Vibrio sp. 10N.261.55.A7]PMJ89604.1 TMAO reductase system periplasmic protein TorT [Vibrio sp. 10N.261.55.A7]